MTIDLEAPVRLGRLPDSEAPGLQKDVRVAVSLLGGPLHRLGKRLGLVRGESNTVLLGIVIGWTLWLMLILLALGRGIAGQLFAMAALASHLRLLVVIPLLFFAEASLDPMFRVFVRSLVDSEVVPVSERPALLSLIQRLNRRKDSWLPDAMCLFFAVVLGATGARVPRYQAIGLDVSLAHSLVATVNFVVAMTVFRFLMLRWVWHLALWFAFLWRLSKLKLRLVATHSDRAGGLGGLEIVQQHLLPLVFALSVLESSTFAEQLYRGMPFASVYPAVVFGVAACVAMAFVPLFLFTPMLMECRHRGFFVYMSLVSRYVTAFEKKWLAPDAPYGELLGSGDMQSLADLTGSVDIVRDMRFIPAGMRLFWAVVVAALIPMLPLWLFQYSITDLLQKFVGRLLGA